MKSMKKPGPSDDTLSSLAAIDALARQASENFLSARKELEQDEKEDSQDEGMEQDDCLLDEFLVNTSIHPSSSPPLQHIHEHRSCNCPQGIRGWHKQFVASATL